MQLTVPPDLEILIHDRMVSGGYASAEDVIRRALESLDDAKESFADEERSAFSAHIEDGYLQAERGELIDGPQARLEIQSMKDNWRLARQ
jgi:Arc/MetJ-type ribon-helix-helix transcriptional regulator